jgi:hypothetical protein
MPYTDPQDRKLAFVPGQKSVINPTAPVGLLFPGDAGVSRGIVHTDYNNIAPRLGIAWDPKGDGRTAVRASFGMFYGSISGNEWNTTADNQPFTVRQSFPTVFTLADPYRNLPGGVSPFPFNYIPGSPRFTLPAQVFGPSLDFVWPVSYQTNITVEKELGKTFSVTASYVGAHGRNLASGVDNNYPVFGPTATTANVNARRPYLPGTIGSATVLSSIFASDYNGLQVSAERRGSRLTGKAYYSFGRGYEDVDFQGGGLPGVQDAMNLAAERGRNSNDRTHSLVLSGVFKVDYLRTSTSPLRFFARDWTVSAIATFQTGTPLTIGAGTDRNFDGLTNDRADLVGNPELDHSRPIEQVIEGWFNVAAFAVPAVGTDGNSGRNIIDGPGIRNVDLGIFRDVPLKGRSMFQFRIEATNVFNIVNLNNPGTSLNAPATFGKIRSARNMRQIQLGGRVSF